MNYIRFINQFMKRLIFFSDAEPGSEFNPLRYNRLTPFTRQYCIPIES